MRRRLRGIVVQAESGMHVGDPGEEGSTADLYSKTESREEARDGSCHFLSVTSKARN